MRRVKGGFQGLKINVLHESTQDSMANRVLAENSLINAMVGSTVWGSSIGNQCDAVVMYFCPPPNKAVLVLNGSFFHE